MKGLSMTQINNFWNGKRYLFYGFSHKKSSIARQIFKKLGESGVEFIPIRKNADEIDGVKMLPDASRVEGEVDGAFIVVNTKNALGILDELAANNIKRVFFQIGAYNKEFAQKAEEMGFDWDTGCALTRFDKMGFPHSNHRWKTKKFGGMK